jgi:probable rRNA maturation factor
VATVDVAVEEGVDADEAGIGADAEAMLAALGLDEAELSVLITHDEGIRALNAQWRGKDEPTDVLSFPQSDPDEPDDAPVGLLGDLVVSVDTARAQAAEQGHDLRSELRVLLAHGLAHLLGHDHHEPDETAEMRALEARLLAAVAGAVPGLVERAGHPG